ncbi:hypothetical protein TCAL_03044 [Tigriopus californicus]|uniref:receptor protein-tyrosine kinase n=2 Tax=Tigriopus californicus TaxID=6832 RepID=A0A553NTT4_TIGCA|nr:hypothetical protein TCAL_03044 [Tigriopus californicus]|eukprot:TCALIF_03044-PA protein Name:"Similar to pdgfra Platelet-derived growth factor receptor alpha (Takifugu rubripes)" AED:0.23 eAED:0.23 QI:0/-1/0/1/-1/1/1/0/1331
MRLSNSSEQIEEEDQSLRYVSHLELKSSLYSDTGYYRCLSKNSTNNVESEDSARVYLYVKSKTNLFVSPAPMVHVNVLENSEVVIPCRPTDPSIQMRFIHNDTDITDDLSSRSFKFDPMRGLIILRGQEKHHTGLIVCNATRGDQFETNPVTLIFRKQRDTIDPPIIVAPKGPVFRGSSFQLTCHTIAERSQTGITLEIKLPEETDSLLDMRRYQYVPQKRLPLPDTEYEVKIVRTLIISPVQENDVGNYTCSATQGDVSSMTTYTLGEVHAKNKSFIGEPDFHGSHMIRINSTKDIKWIFTIPTSPDPRFTWFDPKGHEIDHSVYEKYEMTVDEKKHEVTLRIQSASLEDTGHYEFAIEVGEKSGEHNSVQHFSRKVITFELQYVQAPSVDIKVMDGWVQEDKLFIFMQSYNITCHALGYPIDLASIEWTFQKCETTENCDQPRVLKNHEVRPSDNNLNGTIHYRYNSIIEQMALESGKFTCKVCQKPMTGGKCGENSTFFFISEYSSAFMVEEPNSSLIEQDDINFECAGSKYHFDKVVWERKMNNDWLESPNPSNMSQFSHLSYLRIKSVQETDSGQYRCLGLWQNTTRQSKTIQISVLPLKVPTIMNGNNMNGTKIILKPGDSFELQCFVDGRPEPEMQWFKGQSAQSSSDDQKITSTELQNANKHFQNNNQTLVIKYATSTDTGWYHCFGESRAGKYSGSIQISVVQEASLSKAIWISIILVMVALFGIIGCLIWKVKVYNRKFKELGRGEIRQFREGDPSKINGSLNLADQIDLLPYDSRYEFPKDRLHLGRQIGSGAFGRVLKAKASGIVPWESSTIVAVKTIKPHADIMHFRTLMAELKILIHLGKHLNILNLLGACTKNLDKRELLLIVEYCRHGSILSYLHSHKDHFISQVDQDTLEIDFEIGKELIDTFENDLAQTRDEEELSVAYHGRRTISEFSADGDNSAHIVWNNEFERHRHPSRPQSGVRYVKDPAHRGNNRNQITRTRSNQSDYHDGLDRQVNTDMTTLTNFSRESGRQNSRNSHRSQNSQRRNTRQSSVFESGTNLQLLCTKDLLSWAYQIANGMNYLSERKVLHGDLACRNILLAANNVVKICDFGLAKNMYKNNNYVKKSDVPMPIKWMAVESLNEYIFSIQSDIWSFGIVLWEMFTLGKTPYPGVEGGEHFSNVLSGGYRMERPDLCPQVVYDIMTKCWQKKPGDRPPFTWLIQAFDGLLDDPEKSHYLQLNQDFQVQMRRAPINNPLTVDNKGYLDLFSAPTFEHQMNHASGTDPHDDNGYLLPSQGLSEDGQKILEDEESYLLANNTNAHQTAEKLAKSQSSDSPDHD